MSKNILICTENLGIGGVESVVINQAITLRKKGYKVYVLAGNGENKQKLEIEGIEIIEYNFKVVNMFDVADVDKIVSIIKEKEISEIHIHKIICIPLMLMVCGKLNLPYVYYAHDEIPEVYDWFIDNFNIYSLSIKIFLENAYKIICISENAKKYIEQNFNIENQEKYIIKRNSVNFDIYIIKQELSIKEVKKFLIVSRIAHEKIVSVKNSIKVFCKYTDQTGLDTKLTIVGDGDKKEEIEELVRNLSNKYNIQYDGAVDNVTDIINENDVILGLNRCVLEAMAIKRIAVLSGYKNLKGIITPQNIDLALEDNLSGNNLEDVSLEKQVEELVNLSKQRINEITEFNFEKLKKENDINNNLFVIENCNETTNMDYSDIYLEINKMSEKIINLKKQNDAIWKEREFFCKQNECKEKKILDLEKENNKLLEERKKLSNEIKRNTDELNVIKEGKVYKLIDKINRIKGK